MKKFISITLTFVLLLSCAISFCYANNTDDSSVTVVNEYEAYKELKNMDDSSLAKMGYDDNEIKKIKEFDYVKELRKLSKIDRKSLKSQGYSEKQIDLVKSLENPSIELTEAQLIAASATVSLTKSKTYSSKANGKSSISFSWKFTWSSKPIFTGIDAVAFSWSGDFYCHETYVSAEIDYLKSDGTYITVDRSDAMVDGISPASNGVSVDFMVSPDPIPGWAKKGSGSFYLMCDDHSHNSIQVQSSYGHGIVTLGDISITYGAPSITFNNGVQKLSNSVATYTL